MSFNIDDAKNEADDLKARANHSFDSLNKYKDFIKVDTKRSGNFYNFKNLFHDLNSEDKKWVSLARTYLARASLCA